MDTMIELPALLRSAELAPNTVDTDTRTVEVIWSAGARGRRSTLFGEPYDEELSVDPDHVRLDRLNAGAPPMATAIAKRLKLDSETTPPQLPRFVVAAPFPEPFVFDRVEVGTVGWRVFQTVSGPGNDLDGVSLPVKGCVIHNQNRPRRQFRDQIAFKPMVKDVCIDVRTG